MKRRASDSSTHDQLVGVIHDVRRRWRLKNALRGAAVLAIACLVGVVLGTLALRLAGASPPWVLAVRVTIGLLAVGITAWLLLLPLVRRVSDEQVALYLEENEPTLRSSLISALAADRGQAEGVSPGLARKTIETALARCRAVEDGRRIEQRSLHRSSAVLGGAAVMGLLLFALGPGFVRTGARTLFLPAADGLNLPPGVFAVVVTPGDTSIARGADLAVTAALISALSDEPLPKDSVAFGEVALSGEIRPAGRTDLRLKEAAKLGCSNAFAPPQKKGVSGELRVRHIEHIADLAAAIAPAPRSRAAG